MSIIGVVVLAELIVVLTGGIDISVGSALGLAAVVSAGLFGGPSVLLALLVVAVVIGGIVGAVNGWLVAFRGLEPFIVTLGMLALARGLVYAYGNGIPINPGAAASFAAFGQATFIGIPVLAIIWMVDGGADRLPALPHRVGTPGLRHRLQQGSRAQLGHPGQGHACGRSTSWPGCSSAWAAGCSSPGSPAAPRRPGTCWSWRPSPPSSSAAPGLSGGYGKVFGAVVGTIIFAVIANLLSLLNVSTFLQDAFRGALILVAVTLATVQFARRAARSTRPSRPPSRPVERDGETS